MASSLNRTKYAQLLAKALPRVIHNEDELSEFTDVLMKLADVEKRSREERELSELLTTLIEQYEASNYPIRKPTPLEVVQFLLDQQGLTAKDLWPVVGSRGNTSEILSGKRNISIGVAIKLGRFFNTDPAIFIEWKAVA